MSRAFRDDLFDFAINIKANIISNAVPKLLNKDSKKVPIIFSKDSRFTIPNNQFFLVIKNILLPNTSGQALRLGKKKNTTLPRDKAPEKRKNTKTTT